jgi:hypothetical protein
MNNTATPITILFEKAEDYSKTSLELFKLHAISKSADAVSSLATRLVIVIVVAFFMLCVNIGLALWIGELLGKYYYGFFLIAGCYAIIALLVYAFRYPLIKEPVSNIIITKLIQQNTV